MYGNSSGNTSQQQAMRIADRLLRCWPPQEAGDLQIVTANLIELLMAYPQFVAERAPNAVNGLPAKFKFFPRTAEIKETFEEWAQADRRTNDLRERYDRPVLPAIEGPPRRSARQELCERFGIRDIPRGWDAVDVHKASARYGDMLPEVVEQMLKAPPTDRPKSVFAEVADKAKAAMGRDNYEPSPLLRSMIEAESEKGEDAA